uniref:FERM domain-containing protein n=1 Tax=Strongyloides papillosus TaxID=174720 RepID=A0A0N5BH59_STREA
MSDKGRRAEVVLINGFKFEIILTKKLKVEELIILAGNQCQIYEPDLKYFGIAYVNEKDHYIWLKRDKKVIDCELPGNWYINENILNQDILLQFYFAVKYFVPNFITLSNPGSAIMFFLEAKSLFLRGYLDLPIDNYSYMYALILQYYRGDYVSHNMYSVLSLSIYFPKNILTKLQMTAEGLRTTIGYEYQKLIGMSKGEAVVKFLTLAEKSFTYGSRLYHVKDKNNTSYLLAINNRGICQYTNDLQFKLRRIFHWKNLDNFHYVDQHFNIEVETSPNNHLIDEIDASINDNILGGNDHDGRLSSSIRNSMVTPMVIKQKYNFFCESSSLCRVLWDAAVNQHQFYLDQMSNSKNKNLLMNYSEHDQSIESDFKHIIENINGVLTNNILTLFANNESSSKMSTHSLMSNLTTSSLNENDSMSDVRIIGIINGSQNTETEGEKERRLKAYKGLKDKKNKLEELLLQKLDDLKYICIEEAELTGELPKEIYRTLAPGEPEPKIKKRVGTAFKLSNDILNNANKNDTVNKLEMEIDLQRKIVDAASRLASDKTTNKSVRKKRRRDFEAASQKLKGLELGLQKMHMARSKPDLSSVDFSRPRFGSHLWQGHSGMPRSSESLKSLVTKSCPTTPRGSLSDLSYYKDNRTTFGIDTTGNVKSITNVSDKSENAYYNLSNASSGIHYNNHQQYDMKKSFGMTNNNSPPSIPSRRANSIVSIKPTTFVKGYSLDNEKIEEQSKSYHDINNIPIYANIGYHTSAPYISSYRQSHYPTLFDQQVARNNNRQGRSNSVTPANGTKKIPTNNSVAAAASTQMGLIVKQISQSSLINGPYTTPSNSHYNSIYNNTSPIGADKHINCNSPANSTTYFSSKNDQHNRLPMKDSNGIMKSSVNGTVNQGKVTTFPATYDRIGNCKVAPESTTLTKAGDKQLLFKKEDWRKNAFQLHNLTNQRIESLLNSYRNDPVNGNNMKDDLSNKSSTATIV